jgi:hypothetical protein
MGIMEDAQEMAKKAQEAAAQQAGGAGMDTAGVDVERMQWTNEVGANGLDGEGTITAIKETGNVDAGGSKEFEIEVDASLGGDVYKATALQFLHAKAEDAYKEGAKFELKVDPNDKTRVLLMAGL